MAEIYYEDHPTDPDKVIIRKPYPVKFFGAPQREWVGLTDEERLSILLTAPPTFMNHNGNAREIAYTFGEALQKLTEKKLKEKNT